MASRKQALKNNKRHKFIDIAPHHHKEFMKIVDRKAKEETAKHRKGSDKHEG